MILNVLLDVPSIGAQTKVLVLHVLFAQGLHDVPDLVVRDGGEQRVVLGWPGMAANSYC